MGGIRDALVGLGRAARVRARAVLSHASPRRLVRVPRRVCSGHGRQLRARIRVCIELASKGINVVVTGRSSGKLEALCRRAQDEFHVKCVVVVQDVQKKPDWDRVVEQLKGLDISVLVNNVGGGNVEGVVKPLHEYTLEEHDFIQQLNWGAAFGWTYRLLPIMHRRQKGRVLMISSLTCYACYSGIYSANKLALYGLTRTINNEYLPAIRAETIHVGLVSTPAVALTSTDQLGVVVSSEYCARQTLASFGFREEYVPTLIC